LIVAVAARLDIILVPHIIEQQRLIGKRISPLHSATRSLHYGNNQPHKRSQNAHSQQDADQIEQDRKQQPHSQTYASVFNDMQYYIPSNLKGIGTERRKTIVSHEYVSFSQASPPQYRHP
jgi:hypothetical protein